MLIANQALPIPRTGTSFILNLDLTCTDARVFSFVILNSIQNVHLNVKMAGN